jgi:hypothetical protein
MANKINPAHRYLIKNNARRKYVGSTDDLGAILPPGFCLVDTLGEDGLGTVDGRRGIPDFLKRSTP